MPGLGDPIGKPSLADLQRQCARRLDRHCAGRPRLVRALAVYHDSSPGLASLLTDAIAKATIGCPPPPPFGRLTQVVSRVGQRWAGHVTCFATPARQLACTLLARSGCGVSRSLVDPHRPAADHRRCRVVCVAGAWIDVGLQRQQTRRLALEDNEDAGARTGRAALARLGGGDLTDRQWGCQAEQIAQPRPQVSQLPEQHIARKRATGQRPARALGCFRRGPAGHPGRTLSGAAPAGGVHTARTVAEQSRDCCRSALCLPTAAQSSIREKPTLESLLYLHINPYGTFHLDMQARLRFEAA